MKKAIVTGANGFVGSALVRELLEYDYRVWALGREERFYNLPNDPRVTCVSFELSNIAGIKGKLPAGEYDAFFHFAWEGSAGPARGDTALQLKNAQWAVDALRMSKELGCKRFLCAGSISEHETLSAVYSPGNRPGMGYIYGGGKLIAHVMCTSVAAQIGIDLVWPKITNAYGEGERSPRMVNTAIQKCIRGESPQFTAGTQNYDFVYIDDVARAFRLIAERGKPFHEYLIGSSAARPLKEFLLEMQAAIAPDIPFLFGALPFTGVDLPLSMFDCSQTEADTGFRAEISFAEGCRRTMEWWKQLEVNPI